MKPMLAAPAPLAEAISWPKLASPKLDGVRARVRDGQVLSRSIKPIPNAHVQSLFGRLEGLDGELIVGSPTAANAMQATTSGVMSRDGAPDVTFWVFDCWDLATEPFHVRQIHASARRLDSGCLRAAAVPHQLLGSAAELDEYESQCLALGYEGVMLRDPAGPYKHGRSTAREGWLLKVKRFVDSEAVVIGYEELQHNENEATVNALGLTERSTAKAGKRGAGTLGALHVRDVHTGAVFSIGTGWTVAERAQLWAERESLVSRILTYKSFAASGVLNAPRFPTFKAWRDRRDMS